MEVTEQEREQEQQHFFEVLNALRAYDLGALREVARRERHARHLPAEHLARLPPGMLDRKVTAMKQAVTANAEFLRAVAECAPFGAAEGVDVAELPERAVSALHTSKTISTLHQCVRDWSAEVRATRGNGTAFFDADGRVRGCRERRSVRSATAASLARWGLRCP